MLTFEQFKTAEASMRSILPTRTGSEADEALRQMEFYRLLSDLHPSDFQEACDRILYEDGWYPTVARIREVAAICLRERVRRQQAIDARKPPRTLVCGRCRGNRWLRLGGYDPMNMHAGEEGSRAVPCPDCTVDGRYAPSREAQAIRFSGGVADPNGNREIDMATVTWPETMASLRDPSTGRVDMDALYRLSRELRGLDAAIDERAKPAAGFQTIGTAERATR